MDDTAATTGFRPLYSRAFDSLLARSDVSDGAVQRLAERFFVPSYLKESTYVHKLKEAHKTKLQALKESKPSAGTEPPSKFSALPSSPLPPGSHRGMSHTVIERTIPTEDDDNLAPLPSRWSRDGTAGYVDVSPDELSFKYGPKSPPDSEQHAAGIRTDHFMPPQCGIYYYEISVTTEKREECQISLGFSTASCSLQRPVGWEPESWGYHGDDGRAFTGQNIGKAYGPKFYSSDIIGCGVNFFDHTVFFTRNGTKLNTAFHDVPRGKYYPFVSVRTPGDKIRANFGQSPFVYDIDKFVEEQRQKIQKSIDEADVSSLEPGLNETELVQSLVLQLLQHDGYVETARAFAQDIQYQKEALNIDNAPVEGINIRDDEDANNRQRIRKAILEGDIDKALKYTTAFYPHVLQDNEQVFFKLQCRRFIEMVRKAAYLNMTGGELRASTGHASEESSQAMDVDKDGVDGAAWDGSMDEDQNDKQLEVVEVERRMLEYGQELQATYGNDPRKEVTKDLTDIWALVAYKNPLKEPTVSHLLDATGRVAVAEELNSAILQSLGKSSRAALEKLWAQTSVLLEDLRQDSGEGAFVSLQALVDGIPRSPTM